MRYFCVQARSHSVMIYNPIVIATKGFYPPYATEPVPKFVVSVVVTCSDFGTRRHVVSSRHALNPDWN